MVAMQPEMSTAELEAVADKLFLAIEKMADLYLEACRAGLSQRTAFNTTRRAFERVLGFTPVQAANWARIVVAAVGKQVGEQVYTPADFRVIIRRAMGEF